MIFKKFNIFIIMIFLSFFSGILFGQKHPRELSKPADIKFEPETPEDFTLSNGIKVFYLENKELPLVSVSGLFKGGSLNEPSEKSGLSNLMATVMRTGGTKTMTGDQIDEELEFLASSIDVNMGNEYAGASLNCLKKDFKRVLELYADILMNPEFRQEKIDLAKNQGKEQIRRRWDQPDRASGELFAQKLYGDKSPYSRRSSYKTLTSIKREDLIDLHKKYFAPNNFYITITGDISKDEAKKMLDAAFKTWKKKDVKVPDVAPLAEKADGTIYYANKETPQANIYLGHFGVKYNNPDQYKIDLLNNIFGVNFTSRLMKELRSNRGWTYGIRGSVGAGKDKGVFQISSQMKAANCVEAIETVKKIIIDMQTNLVSDDEFDRAINSTINSFVFRFEQKDRYLAMYLNQRMNGFPDNYWDKYIDNIKKVTKEDIRDAAKKYMNPEKMIIVVVGDEKRFDKPLSTLGKVVNIDLSKIMEEEKSEN